MQTWNNNWILRRIGPVVVVFTLWLSDAAGQEVPQQDVVSREVIHSFNLENVRLLPGRLNDQFEEVRAFYMKLQPNDILKGFRERSGKYAPGKELGGAYSETPLSFGQWLGGFARVYRATADTAARDRAIYLMEEWAKTIDKDGHFGYGKNGVGHYEYEKFVGGLVDIYEFTGNTNALKYLGMITDWAEKNLSRSNEYALPTEWYTLSENLYRAYELTGDQRYRDFAKVWEYSDFWSTLARKEDVFKALEKAQHHRSYHAYSTVNSLSSAAMAYGVTGERHYLDTIVNGYDFLRDSQLYATGGYGPEEQLVVPNGMPETLVGIRRGESDVDVRFHFETTCGSWAGFKLAKYLMRYTGEANYGDWIERLIYNGVGALLPMNDYGMIMYGSCYHTYGAQKSLFTVWFCCQGSLLQTVTDYHDLIYFHDRANLYVNLFVPSEVKWQSPGGAVTLRQETSYPESEDVTLTVATKQPSQFGLKIRVPLWVQDGIDWKLNDEPIKVAAVPGQWATIERNWHDGDVIRFRLPVKIHEEPAPGCVSPVAVMAGPVVLVMTTARNSEGGMPVEGPLTYPGDWLEVNDQATLNPARQLDSTRLLRPFYEVKAGEYYNMYFERFGKRIIPSDKVNFTGDWASGNFGRSSAKAGDSFNADFSGSVLLWEGFKRPDAGIAEVSIDGKPVAEVDQYEYSDVHVGRMDQREVPFRWSVKHLGAGKHSVKVIVAGKKNAESSDTRINLGSLSAYP
jgi:DUF1680 family protein